MAASTPGRGITPPCGQRTAWTAGRVVPVVTGSVLALVSAVLLVVGAVLLWTDQTQRSGSYLTAPSRALGTSGYAVTSDLVTLQRGPAGWANGSLLGRIRVRVTAATPGQAVFAGIAPARSVRSYLAGAPYATVTGFTSPAGVTYTAHAGTATPAAPLSQHIWSARVSGTGTQSLTWQARAGNWIIVVMNGRGAPGLSVIADAGATLPSLTGIAAGFLAGGVAAAAAAVALILLPVRAAGRARPQRQASGQLPGPPPPSLPVRR